MDKKANFISTQCAICGGKMDIDLSAETVECPFCGNAFPTENYASESDAVKIEKIKSTVELKKLQLEKEKFESEDSKEKTQSFKKSKFSKFLIICAIFSLLCCWVSFNDGKILSGFIALIQVVLYTASWQMGMQIIKEPKKGIRVLATILAFVLIIPYFGTYNSTSFRISSHIENFSWSDIVLSKEIPQPSSLKGEVFSNTDKSFRVDVADATKKDYESYVDACKSLGFTVDEESSDFMFEAYNQQGDHILVKFLDFTNQLTINYDKAMTMEQITWPNNAVVKQLPVPKSLYGKIGHEYSDSFAVYLGDFSKSDYDAYVNECMTLGFNVNYSKFEKSFYADNAGGIHLSIEYKGNNIMYLSIRQSANNTTENKSEEDSNTTTPAKTGISDDFKSAMDSYEKFFDEYVTFMKKYANSDGTDMKILADYASYMKQYADTMAKFEAMENDDLSPEEAAYYIQVQGRITKKLLEAAQ